MGKFSSIHLLLLYLWMLLPLLFYDFELRNWEKKAHLFWALLKNIIVLVVLNVLLTHIKIYWGHQSIKYLLHPKISELNNFFHK